LVIGYFLCASAPELARREVEGPLCAFFLIINHFLWNILAFKTGICTILAL